MTKYTVHQEKTYEATPEAIYSAALGAVEGLQGKVLEQDAAAHTFKAQFDKKIHGKVLGDRTQMAVAVKASGNGAGDVAVEIFPIDPVGRALQFGARKGVSQQVLTWFFAHLEHRL